MVVLKQNKSVKSMSKDLKLCVVIIMRNIWKQWEKEIYTDVSLVYENKAESIISSKPCGTL